MKRLRLRLVPGRFAVARLGPRDAVPAGLDVRGLLSITRTPDELSIVCAEGLLPEGTRIENGWRCLAVQGPLPFSAIGILSSLAGPLAEAEVSVFAISTFETDYLLVPGAQLDRALSSLAAAGHEVAGLER